MLRKTHLLSEEQMLKYQKYEKKRKEKQARSFLRLKPHTRSFLETFQKTNSENTISFIGNVKKLEKRLDDFFDPTFSEINFIWFWFLLINSIGGFLSFLLTSSVLKELAFEKMTQFLSIQIVAVLLVLLISTLSSFLLYLLLFIGKDSLEKNLLQDFFSTANSKSKKILLTKLFDAKTEQNKLKYLNISFIKNINYLNVCLITMFSLFLLNFFFNFSVQTLFLFLFILDFGWRCIFGFLTKMPDLNGLPGYISTKIYYFPVYIYLFEKIYLFRGIILFFSFINIIMLLFCLCRFYRISTQSNFWHLIDLLLFITPKFTFKGKGGSFGGAGAWKNF